MRQNRVMSLERIAWIVTAGLFLAAAIVGLALGYQGYAALGLAIAASAAINLT